MSTTNAQIAVTLATPIIIGVAVGGFVLLFMIGLGIYCCCRRRNREHALLIATGGTTMMASPNPYGNQGMMGMAQGGGPMNIQMASLNVPMPPGALANNIRNNNGPLMNDFNTPYGQF